METRKYCVYNQTRESFLSLGVTVADTAAKQLKVLMENLSIKADAGLWLTPFSGSPRHEGADACRFDLSGRGQSGHSGDRVISKPCD